METINKYLDRLERNAAGLGITMCLEFGTAALEFDGENYWDNSWDDDDYDVDVPQALRDATDAMAELASELMRFDEFEYDEIEEDEEGNPVEYVVGPVLPNYDETIDILKLIAHASIAVDAAWAERAQTAGAP